MDLKIYPHNLKGIVEAPPSKSYTHRAIICGSLAKGRSVINNPLICDDTLATINALKAIGTNIVFYETRLEIDGITKVQIPKKPIDCRESASTLRMLLPYFSTINHQWTFTGSEYLIERIQEADLMELKGLKFQKEGKELKIWGNLDQTHYLLGGNITSQFISGMIMVLPFLHPNTTLSLYGVNILNPYVQLTLETCRHFGLEFNFKNNTDILVKPNSFYKNNVFDVEGDFSNAACWVGASYFNEQLRVGCLNSLSQQGDARIFSFLQEMGVQFKLENCDYSYLSGKIGDAEIDITETPDLGPILAAIASLGTGTVIISGIEKLSYKESNRALSIMDGLNRLGGNVKIVENKMIIQGKPLLEGGVEVDSYNDHRIIMALSILGSRIRLPFIIKNFLPINKSYPNFFDVFQRIGGKFEVV
ncbi:MAG: 3-phosphoshikimate 1-carboxyvinyltransferase [Bacilli bacterium]